MLSPLPPRRPTLPPELPRGSGDIDNSGELLRDLRPRGFWARITEGDGETNAYGWVRCDDGRPDTFPQLLGLRASATQPPIPLYYGTTTQAPAYETSGSTSVPTSGSVVVWLEPLLATAGYGFTYVAPSTALTAGATGFAETVGLEPDEWTEIFTLTLPGPGTYLLTGKLTAQVSATLDEGAYALVQACLGDADGNPVASFANVVQASVSGTVANGTGPLVYLHTDLADEPVVTVLARVVTSGGATDVSASVTSAAFDNSASDLTWLKLA